MSEKQALVLKRTEVAEIITTLPPVSTGPESEAVAIVGEVPEEFFSLTPILMSRAECENDTNYLQLIPYIMVCHRNKVLMYRRGRKSGEGRLVDMLSAGFGGHIDELPSAGESFKDLIAREAVRELKEELGIVVNLTGSDVDKATLIYTDATEVDEVHLGLTFVIMLSDEEALQVDSTAEKGIIDELAFYDAEQLLKKAQSGAELEVWTNLVFAKISSI